MSDKNRINKEKIKTMTVIMAVMAITCFLTYKAILHPLSNINTLKKDMRSKEREFKEKEEELSTTKKILTKRIELKEKEKREYEELKERHKKNSFENIGKFELYIEQTAAKNNVAIVTVGGPESTDDTQETGKIFCPYILEGKETDIRSFIDDMESSEYLLDITGAPITLENNENYIKIVFKIGACVTDIKYEIEDEYEEKETILINKLIDHISSYEIMELNGKKYAILRYKDKKRKIIRAGESIMIDEVKYNIIIKNGKIYLEE